MERTNRYSIGLLMVLASGCSLSINQPIPEKGWNVCQDPRPQICTMEYLPVCGETREGERVTHASGCSACAHPEILRYRAGACE